jgi:CheY-like chemotaxis protein
MTTAARERIPAPLDGLRVLVVDDEPDTLQIMRVVLERSGARVTTADSVKEALEAMENSWPDVLVSDIGMPVEDGYDLIRKVRLIGTERGAHVPAVALTAYTREEDRARSLAEGYEEYLPKPIDPSELIKLLARLAQNKRSSISAAES